MSKNKYIQKIHVASALYSTDVKQYEDIIIDLAGIFYLLYRNRVVRIHNQ